VIDGPSRPSAATRSPLFRQKDRAFRAIPGAVPTCRRLVRIGLFAHGLADLADDACAVTGELAANAVNAMQIEQRAGRLGRLLPLMVLSLDWMSAGIRVGLWDGSPGLPDLRIPAWREETGRGLLIVDALTGGRWGWFATDAGKCVWAEIVRPAAPSHSADRLLDL
jgi:hypothetical protein